jgi:hypothetical protein
VLVFDCWCSARFGVSSRDLLCVVVIECRFSVEAKAFFFSVKEGKSKLRLEERR